MFKERIKKRYLFFLDILLCLIAYIAVILVVFPVEKMFYYLKGGVALIFVTALVYGVVFSALNIYKTDWVYAGVTTYVKLIFACVFATVISIMGGLFISTGFIYPKINLAANIFAVAFICGLRFLIRVLYKLIRGRKEGTGKRVLIIGAGRLAIMLLRDFSENIRLNYEVVGLIDDDSAKLDRNIYDAEVVGNRNDIKRVCKERHVEEIIFAIHTIPSAERTKILDICSETGCKVRILPGVEEALNGNNEEHGKIRDIEIEDLLERDPIKLNNELISSDICGKTILVTGGGGSIGSELCRQIMKYAPRKLIILDIYENTTYELQNELEEKYSSSQIDVLIASVRDKERLNDVFVQYKPDIVFHAAAHKHVPLMEFSPSEAIKNNVFGTYNVAKCAIEFGVKRFVMISTDKAVNPTNVMGATKRLCEMIIQTFSKLGKTEFVAVRFGNVLGSNGSVIPRFKKQIEEGGPLTVTHPEITRFFMTIPEAAQLVLQAAAYAKGGEIFVLDMGQPVKIYDLARKLISLSGYKPDEDIKIMFTGLRPGEKLYEELLMNEEGLTKTAHSKIFVGKPIEITPAELTEKLELLKDAIQNQDREYIKKIVSKVVPTYKPEI